MINIRKEKHEKYRDVENIVPDAFWNVYKPECDEHYLLHQYRTNPDYVEELSEVMTKEGKLIGQIMYSRGVVTRKETGK